MPSYEIVQMDRDLMDSLRRARTVADRERLVVENLRRKESFFKRCEAERLNLIQDRK